MRHRSVLYVLLAGVVVLVALFGAITVSRLSVYNSALSQGLSSLMATPIHHYGAEAGPSTAVLISPDNVTLQILAIQKDATAWLFRIQAHNRATRAVAILDATTNHYFALALVGAPGTSYTWQQLTISLQEPTGIELAAHPALASTVAAGAQSDGWLVADLTESPYPPVELFYVYATVTAPQCSNPQDPSTCHQGLGYRTLVWQVSPAHGD